METLLVFCLFLLLLFLGAPIAIALAASVLPYILFHDIPFLLLPQRMAPALTNFILLAIPLYILVGELMNTTGITERIFRFAESLVAPIPGGLGHVNVIASMIFAGMSGSAIADAGGLGAVEIKAMKDAGYEDKFSASITAASCTVGPIIPPSVPIIVYASLTETSVGRLFAGGLIPGVVMGLSLMTMIYLVAKGRPDFPVHQRLPLRMVWINFKRALLPLLTPVIILFGVMGGIFTPTEAGGIGALYAIILGTFVYKELTLKDLIRSLDITLKRTGIIMFILAGAYVFAWIVAREAIGESLAAFFQSITDSPYVILIVLNVVVLILGCFMQPIAIQLICVPMFIPLLEAYGISLIHFGLVLILNIQIGLCTPPFGNALFVVSDVANITFEQMSKATLPFLIPLIITLLLITYIPELVLFVPDLIFGK